MSGQDSSVYGSGFLAVCGFQSTGSGNTSRCEHCQLEIHQWTLDMNPLEIHSERSPNCAFILALPVSSPSMTDYEQASIQITEDRLLQDVRIRTISHWSRYTAPSSAHMIEAGFFNCNVSDRVICIYCNLICEQWNMNTDNPCELHRTLSPNCNYVRTKLANSPVPSAELDDGTRLTDKTNVSEVSQKNKPDEIALTELVADRLNQPMSQQLLKKYFNITIVRRCWEDQLRLKQMDFQSHLDLFIACLILQKQIQYNSDNEENIIVPSIAMERRREEMRNWKEDREVTRKREASLISWPHRSPSPIQMLQGGWYFDTTNGVDHTICLHCQSAHDNWQTTDDPLRIHNDLANNCPLVCATAPLHQSSVPNKRVQDVYTDEEIEAQLATSNSKIILPFLSETNVIQRANSFQAFPRQLSDDIVHRLAIFGFFYTDIGRLIKCYACLKIVVNFDQHLVDEIIREHCSASSNCAYAQLVAEQTLSPNSSSNKHCHWCLCNLKELVAFRCQHLVVCDSCANWISLCPICRSPAESFFRVFL